MTKGKKLLPETMSLGTQDWLQTTRGMKITAYVDEQLTRAMVGSGEVSKECEGGLFGTRIREAIETLRK